MPCARVTIGIDGGACGAQLFTPAIGDGPWPAAIVYMDAAGIRPALAAIAQRIADAGHAVLLPDLFHRFGAYGPLVPAEVLAGDAMAVIGPMMATTDNRIAAADTRAFLAWLDTRAEVAAGRIGAVGFCMGGGMAIVAAASYPDRFAAVASFHGGMLATEDAASPHRFAATLATDLLVAVAHDDPYCPPAMTARLETALDDAGVRHRTETYPAAHGWMVPDLPAYDAAQAARGWDALLDLFARTLRR